MYNSEWGMSINNHGMNFPRKEAGEELPDASEWAPKTGPRGAAPASVLIRHTCRFDLRERELFAKAGWTSAGHQEGGG